MRARMRIYVRVMKNVNRVSLILVFFHTYFHEHYVALLS